MVILCVRSINAGSPLLFVYNEGYHASYMILFLKKKRRRKSYFSLEEVETYQYLLISYGQIKKKKSPMQHEVVMLPYV